MSSKKAKEAGFFLRWLFFRDLLCYHQIAASEDRFDVIFRGPNGFHHPFIFSGYAGGVTVFLNPDGTPVVTPREE